MVKPPPFVHLHNHSEFSLLDGAARIGEMIDTAIEMGMPAIALTDHGNLFGAYQFYQAALAANKKLEEAGKPGLKPIIGCEVYVAKESRHNKTSGSDQSNHLVLLAQDATGYQNLSRLVSYGFLEGFYYRPRIDKELLSKYCKGLIGLSACLKGAVPQKLAQEQPDAALAEALELRDILGDGNFYLELQDHGIAAQRRINPLIVEMARKTGISLVCTNDSHYMRREDSEAHDVLLCIGTGKLVSQTDRLRYDGDQFYFKSPEEMYALWKEVPEAIENTLRIAERCNVKIEKLKELPPFAVPSGFDCNSYFEKIVREGFEERRPHLEKMAAAGQLRQPMSEYEARLNDEIAMIQKMEFPSYFLIVWDLLRYSRENNIPVGPGRGSVVGSLVSYSMKITDVDPLQYALFFERFLNPERYSPPDIDMDFCAIRRPEVIQYATEKYGRDCVCQIITFGTMAARGVIRDVGRALNIELKDVDRIAKLIPAALDITLDKALAQEPRIAEEMKDPRIAQLIEVGRRLEGLSRNPGKHAAGVVIAPSPLIDLIPLYKPSKDNEDEITTQYNMKDLEKAGLLKMDFLGLATLTVIDGALRYIKEGTGVDLDIADIPLNDPDVYKLFSAGSTNGVFQFESGGMKAELRRLKPDRFEDLIAMNALYRPGPMDMIPDFIRRRHGRVEVEYPHPLLETILKETYGVIVYQEQVMQAARVVAGYTLGSADILRRAMGKKDVKEMARHRDIFVKGAAQTNKMDAKTANAIFDLLEKFAQYGFNKSHSTAYALLAYQTAWLKVHYPVQFMASVLSNESRLGNTEKIVLYISECREMGIPVLPPDINESMLNFHPSGDGIRFGMLAIRNVGEGAINSIIEYREKKGRFRNLFQFCEELDSRALNKRVMESLVKSGALDSLGWKRSQSMTMIDTALEHSQKVRRDRESGQKGLFAMMTGGQSALPEPIPPDVPEWPLEERLVNEKETIGFYVSGHPLDKFKQEISSFCRKNIAELVGEGKSTECRLAGIVTEFQQRRTKKGDLMATFSLEDISGSVKTVVFPNTYKKCESYLTADHPLLVSGKLEFEDENSCQLIASELQPLTGIMERSAKTLWITTDIRYLDPDAAESLHRLFESNRGETGIEVELYHPGNFRVNIQSSDFVKVKSSPELIQQIEDICGPGSVLAVQ